MAKENTNKFIKEKIKFFVYNTKRNFKVFFSSKYGKVGFYILLAFIVISLISPLIIEHNSPLTYTAPPEDYFVPEELIHSSTPQKDGTVIQASASNSGSLGLGSYLVYYITSHGLYGIFTSNGTVINLLSVSGLKSMITATIISPSSSVDNYIILTSSNSIYEGCISWTSGVAGSGTPSYQYHNITINGTIYSPPISNAITYHGILASAIPCDNTYYKPALLSVIIKNSTNYYLDSFYVDGLSHKSSVQLPSDYSYNSNITYYSAAFKSNSEEVFLVNGNNLLGYSPFQGNLETNVTFSSQITKIYIPHGNNENFNGNNSIYVSSQDKIYQVNIAKSVGNNYQPSTIYSSGTVKILSFSTSAGDSGNPSYYVVSLEDNHVLILNSRYVTIENTKSASEYNEINSVSSHFLLSNGDGYISYLVYLTSSNPYGWGTILHESINNTVNFVDPETAGEAFVTFHGTAFTIYSTSGKDINPLPPTFHTTSGNIYPLGTTGTGKDVWSEFIGAFPSDIYIGVLVGIGVMLIALMAGMFIGYYTGIISSGIETFALAIFLIPGLPLLIVVASIVGPSLSGIIAILILLSWPFGAFTLIGMVRSIKSRTFVDAAVTSGSGTLSILKNHMVKNVMPILIYQTAVGIGGAVAAISTLQILGIAPLSIPTWGGMLADFFKNYYLLLQAPWWFIPPIVAITLFVIAFIFISKGMDRIANPRAGDRR